MRHPVVSLVAVATAAGSLFLIPPAPASAAAVAQCTQFAAPRPVAVGGALTRTGRVTGCTPQSATGGSGTSVTNLNTRVSKTTWTGGNGATTVKLTYKPGPSANNCPSGAHLTIVSGKVTGSSGTASSVIKVGFTLSARWCVNSNLAVTLEPGSVQKFSGTSTPTDTNPPPAAVPLPSSLTACPANAATDVTALINRDRRTHGNLPPLKRNANLEWAARKHAIRMAVKGYSFHDGWDTEIAESHFKLGPPYWTSQNVGWMISYFDPELIESGYFDEKPPNDGHRLNILSTNFHYVGIGCVIRKANGAIFTTEDFGS